MAKWLAATVQSLTELEPIAAVVVDSNLGNVIWNFSCKHNDS